MNGKQYDAILEALSRRKLLKTGSAALAMTARTVDLSQTTSARRALAKIPDEKLLVV
jgi:hypothetical protein